MCIYDDTIFACGASKRRLKQQCSLDNCLPHIHWTSYSADSCADCGTSQPEATHSLFSSELAMIAAGNSCGDMDHIRKKAKRDPVAIVAEPSDFGDDEASSKSEDEWDWLSTEELLDVELDDVDRALLSEIDRSSSRSVSSCENVQRRKQKVVRFAPTLSDFVLPQEHQESPDAAFPNWLLLASMLEKGQALSSKPPA